MILLIGIGLWHIMTSDHRVSGFIWTFTTLSELFSILWLRRCFRARLYWLC